MTFLPGLELSRRFHDEIVGPLLAERLPGLRYAAARLDSGSELFGFDTARSTDHDWGPRLQVFLDEDDPRVEPVLVDGLPHEFLGFPARFAAGSTTTLGVACPDGGRHGVTVTTRERWFVHRLGFDPLAADDGPRPADWLAAPSQRLAELTCGEIFHDGLPEEPLRTARQRLAWYPDDVWRYVLAAQWTRLGQVEHLMGRAGEVGDELGSAVIGAGIVRDLMRLCLLLRRRYPPYAKWLGSAFAELPGIGPVAAALGGALSAGGWQAREGFLCHAYELVGARANEARLADGAPLAKPVDPTVRPFHDRPFLVLDAGRFADALRAEVSDPWLRGLPPVGAVDQWIDSTDALCDIARLRGPVPAC